MMDSGSNFFKSLGIETLVEGLSIFSVVLNYVHKKIDIIRDRHNSN